MPIDDALENLETGAVRSIYDENKYPRSELTQFENKSEDQIIEDYDKGEIDGNYLAKLISNLRNIPKKQLTRNEFEQYSKLEKAVRKIDTEIYENETTFIRNEICPGLVAFVPVYKFKHRKLPNYS